MGASGGHATGDDLNSIEHLIGSAHDDDLIGTDSGNTIGVVLEMIRLTDALEMIICMVRMGMIS